MIQKAQTITGYMTDQDLKAVEYFATGAKVIIELGSWQGKSTRAIADSAPADAIIFAIDSWNGSDYEKSGHAEAKQMQGDYIFNEFLKNNFDHIQDGKIIPLRMYGKHALWLLWSKGIKADMIFIDAGHEYHEVKEDIINCLPVLKEGGVLCGHDYLKEWSGVIKAVDELIPDRQIYGSSIVWYKQY